MIVIEAITLTAKTAAKILWVRKKKLSQISRVESDEQKVLTETAIRKKIHRL